MVNERNIQPPIFVVDRDDYVSVYLSAGAAETQIESPDVDEYRAFDSEGRKLRFLGKTEPKVGRWFDTIAIGPVRLVAEEDEPGHGEDLRLTLLRGLTLDGVPVDELKGLALEELVTRAPALLAPPTRHFWSRLRKSHRL